MANSWIPSSSPSDGLSAPFDRPADKDWNVNSPKMSPDANGNVANGANAMLRAANGRSLGLFVNEITTDFNLAGSVAQSQDKQQFFPHNYAAPRVMISGQTPNGYQYGRLAEVIRQSHRYAIDDGDQGLSDQFRAVTFMTFGNTHKARSGAAGADPKARTGELARTTKGVPSRIVLDGYITSFTRRTERHLVAYDWQFEFVILRAANMLSLSDSSLNRDLVQSVQTIEDALAKAPRAVESQDPFKAYDEAGKMAGGGGGDDPPQFSR